VAAFYADENFPAQVVEALRHLGHDVLTAYEAGQANRAITDKEVVDFATAFPTFASLFPGARRRAVRGRRRSQILRDGPPQRRRREDLGLRAELEHPSP
jgi:hypothetical protein